MSGRRQDILTSARVLFAEHGYDGVSLDAIIGHSRTSKGTMYHYFESKEDLYATMLEEMLDHLWQQVYDVSTLDEVTAETFWSAIKASWRRTLVYMLEHPEQMVLWRGFQEGWRALSDSGPARRLRERSLSMGVSIAQRGQALGVIRTDLSPLECAELVEAVDVVTDRWFFTMVDTYGELEAMERWASRVLNLIWRILAPAHDLRSAGPAFPTLDEA